MDQTRTTNKTATLQVALLRRALSNGNKRTVAERVVNSRSFWLCAEISRHLRFSLIASCSNRHLTNFVIAAAGACLLTWSGTSVAQPRPSVGLQNWALGSASARVTLLEYASLTCSHCAHFNTTIMPTIKRRYVDTGLIRYVLRPLPTQPFDLAVSMHALTLCAGPSRYYPLVNAYFDRQQDVFTAAGGETGPKGIIFAIAEDSGGLSYAASEACLRDPVRQAQVRANAQAAAAAGVTGTPTVFINGVILQPQTGQGPLQLQDYIQAIDAALRTRPPVPQAKKR